MPPLKNQRHELFAQALAKGKTADEAYVLAGFKANRGNATTLKAKQSVVSRVAELGAPALKKTEVTVERVLAELALIAFSDMAEFAEWNESGVGWKPSSELTPEQTRVIGEISQVMNDHGGTTKLKLHDKLSALDKLGRYLKMFVDKVEIGGKDGGPIEVTDARERLVAALSKRHPRPTKTSA